MALRQFTSKYGRPFWSYLSVMKARKLVPVNNSTPRLVDLATKSFSPIKETHINNHLQLSSITPASHNTNFIDFASANLHKRLYMPTNTVNTLKVYQDINPNPVLIEDNLNKVEIVDPRLVVRKEAVRMLIIRRRKMKKHKLKKLRKRMKFVFEKIKMKRNLRKEQDFRTELLSQVEASDKFDAKEYVEKILHTLRYHPKPKTLKELFEERRLLRKMNRYNTSFIGPKFDDD